MDREDVTKLLSKLQQTRIHGSRVVCAEMPSMEKTEGGIYMPDTAKDDPRSLKRGYVLKHSRDIATLIENAKHPDLDLLVSEVNVGDIVYFTRFQNGELHIGNTTLYVVSWTDVYAIESGTPV